MLARYAWLAENDAVRPLLDLAFARPVAAAPEGAPRVDILENDTGFSFVCEVPGARPEDVSVTLEKGRLTVHAQLRARYPQTAAVRRLERLPGELTRSFQLGDGVDPDQVTAALENGLLTVQVAKKPAPTPKKIPVQFHGGAPAAAPHQQLGGEGAGAAPGL
jgi:HSP20 family protein